MNTITRWAPFHLSTLQDQVNRLFESTVQGRGDSAALTAWTPSVDIYETENELVIKADVPGINEGPRHPRGEQHANDPRRAEI
jgi:HSP20 family protein